MCELLIFSGNNSNADPEKDRRGSYKRGMIVCVFEDGHSWGREESKQQWIAEGNATATWPGQGKFVILKLPGVPSSKAKPLLDAQEEDDTGVPLPGTFRRRRWLLQVDSLPAVVRNALARDGEYVTTVTAVRNYLQRVRDSAQFTGLD